MACKTILQLNIYLKKVNQFWRGHPLLSALASRAYHLRMINPFYQCLVKNIMLSQTITILGQLVGEIGMTKNSNLYTEKR